MSTGLRFPTSAFWVGQSLELPPVALSCPVSVDLVCPGAAPRRAPDPLQMPERSFPLDQCTAPSSLSGPCTTIQDPTTCKCQLRHPEFSSMARFHFLSLSRSGGPCDISSYDSTYVILNKYSAPVATYGTRREENIEDPSYLQFLRSDLLKCIPRTRIEHVEQRLITERACFTGTWRRRLHVITSWKMEIGLNAPCRRLIGPGRYKRRIQVPSDIGSGKFQGIPSRERRLTPRMPCLTPPRPDPCQHYSTRHQDQHQRFLSSPAIQQDPTGRQLI